jgi:uncharacterized PurR-regulated membrane protein YhhQ (DUF165 family)
MAPNAVFSASLLKKLTWAVAYLATIILANFMTERFGLVGIGFGLLVSAGTFAAGLALISRDGVQEALGIRWTFVTIVAGCALSLAVSNPAIAVASGLAFIASEIVDLAVFTPTRKKTITGAILLSSIVAAPVDTILFLWIAGFPLTFDAVLGQFLVKTGLALIAAAVLVTIHQSRLLTHQK